jgi:hypothetical protein
MAMFSFGPAKGKIILCQLDFSNDADDEELKALNNRVTSQLLSNIGVAISADIFGKND